MLTEKFLLASVSTSAGGVWMGLTDAVSIAIVTQVGALILAALAAFVSWRTHRAVNSRMDEFKVMFAQAKINEGVLQEKASVELIHGKLAVLVEEKAQAVPVSASVPATSILKAAIAAVPEKTATKVVEKLKE